MTVQIRNTVDSDSAATARLLLAAFGEQEGPEIVDLVANLASDTTARPLHELVATDAGDIVGHILFTAVRLAPDKTPTEAPSVKATILAPLAVAPSRQGQGIGGLLINAGLQVLRRSGTQLVFVLGHPGYYPRYGFMPAGTKGYAAPYPIDPRNADAWMVQALHPGLIGDYSGTVACADALKDPKYWQE